ncbi:Late embryogenesis abundant protein [Macleaya cordata]|uniref:Late embryogenesis abundant protein n=1 Tax=Macleaya cordata TaxID=56857 RepID=A0A200QKZ6_MACCD|nr:Late embryogenesis abundant protein [Macleaya cordata]
MLPKRVSDSRFGFYVWLLQVMIVIGLTSVVIWLCLHPKTPNYTVVGFYVPGLDGQNSAGNVHRNTTLILKLRISNPNKGMGIYYDDNNVALYYGNDNIGVSSILGFYQGHKKTTQREVSVNGVEQFWRAVFRVVSNGTVDLRVSLVSGFRYKIFWWKTRHHRLDLQALVPVALDGKTFDEMNIKLRPTAKK